MRKVSAKRRAYRASEEGQNALEHMRAVKQLPCVVCGSAPPSDAHHVIHDRFSGKKASDLDVIPLCKAHHQNGPEAIHNAKRSWREKHGPDHAFLPLVKEWLSD